MNRFLSRELLRKLLGMLVLYIAGCTVLVVSIPAHAALQCTITGTAAISFGTLTVPRDTPDAVWKCRRRGKNVVPSIVMRST